MNNPAEIKKTLAVLEGVQKEFNKAQKGGKKVSLADLIILSGNAAVEQAAKQAGATFAVSPGATPSLIAACIALELPLLPGAVTPSEAMSLNALGFDLLKFFPAEPYGGIATLKALAGPLPRIRFCPTGGITEASAPNYLALPTVPCVGGSWIVPPALLKDRDWAGIRANALRAAALKV